MGATNPQDRADRRPASAAPGRREVAVELFREHLDLAAIRRAAPRTTPTVDAAAPSAEAGTRSPGASTSPRGAVVGRRSMPASATGYARALLLSASLLVPPPPDTMKGRRRARPSRRWRAAMADAPAAFSGSLAGVASATTGWTLRAAGPPLALLAILSSLGADGPTSAIDAEIASAPGAFPPATAAPSASASVTIAPSGRLAEPRPMGPVAEPSPPRTRQVSGPPAATVPLAPALRGDAPDRPAPATTTAFERAPLRSTPLARDRDAVANGPRRVGEDASDGRPGPDAVRSEASAHHLDPRRPVASTRSARDPVTTAAPSPVAITDVVARLPSPRPATPGAGPEPAPENPRPAGATPSRAARIVVHYNAAGLEPAREVASRLRAEGFADVSLRRVAFSVSRSNVRYFHEADRVLAARSAEGLGAAVPIRDFTHFAPRPTPGTVELWVGG